MGRLKPYFTWVSDRLNSISFLLPFICWLIALSTVSGYYRSNVHEAINSRIVGLGVSETINNSQDDPESEVFEAKRLAVAEFAAKYEAAELLSYTSYVVVLLTSLWFCMFVATCNQAPRMTGAVLASNLIFGIFYVINTDSQQRANEHFASSVATEPETEESKGHDEPWGQLEGSFSFLQDERHRLGEQSQPIVTKLRGESTADFGYYVAFVYMSAIMCSLIIPLSARKRKEWERSHWIKLTEAAILGFRIFPLIGGVLLSASIYRTRIEYSFLAGFSETPDVMKLIAESYPFFLGVGFSVIIGATLVPAAVMLMFRLRYLEAKFGQNPEGREELQKLSSLNIGWFTILASVLSPAAVGSYTVIFDS